MSSNTKRKEKRKKQFALAEQRRAILTDKGTFVALFSYYQAMNIATEEQKALQESTPEAKNIQSIVKRL